MEHLESVVTNVILVTTFNVVDTDQQTVIHNVESCQEFRIPLELLYKEVSPLGSQFQLAVPVDPVEILLRCAGVAVQFLVADGTAQRGALQIVCLVDIPVGWEDVAHDDKVNLLSMRELDTMQTKEAAQKSVRVLFDVLMWMKRDGIAGEC